MTYNVCHIKNELHDISAKTHCLQHNLFFLIIFHLISFFWPEIDFDLMETLSDSVLGTTFIRCFMRKSYFKWQKNPVLRLKLFWLHRNCKCTILILPINHHNFLYLRWLFVHFAIDHIINWYSYGSLAAAMQTSRIDSKWLCIRCVSTFERERNKTTW